MADTKRELGVGIVGCGNISGIYLRNMASFNGVKLIACADARKTIVDPCSANCC